MFRVFYLLPFFALSLLQAQTSDYSIFLIGDAGNDTLAGGNLLTLQKHITTRSNGLTVFLGDNIYPSGLCCDKHPELLTTATMKLRTQLDRVTDYKGQVLFVPGNHDWKNGKTGGFTVAQKEEEYVQSYLKTNHNANTLPYFAPKAGFPGPELLQLNDKINVVAIDLQWWLQRQVFHKVGIEEGGKKQMEADFFAELKEIFEADKRQEKWTIMVAHHPLISNGKHGRKRQPLRFINNWTPLVFLGLMGGYRSMSQDISQPRYTKISRKIQKLISEYQNIVYCSGHDHNLQVAELLGGNIHIISGAGSKLSSFKYKNVDLLYGNDQSLGFFEIQMDADKNLELKAILENGDQKIVLKRSFRQY